MTESQLRSGLCAAPFRGVARVFAVGVFVLACAWPATTPLCAGTPAAKAEEAPAPAPAEDSFDDARFPLYLRGVDLELPAQDAFRDWPGPALTERPYWLPWNWFTFQRARLFNRPVLLVLTAGWSRAALQLDDETFSDPRVLQRLNEGFIAVRVDTGRRPDIRERYHTGGWPSVSLLLPDAMPILSHANPTGKALPITAGFLNADEMLFLLEEGRIYYDKWGDLLAGVGKEWAKIEAGPDPAPGPVGFDASDRLARWLLGNADNTGGGFGAAPKFLVAGLSEYAALRADRLDAALVDHADFTLDQLIVSPLYDKRDGGIHRIATQPNWEGIQYEKLLAQNAAFIRELAFSLRRRPSAEGTAALTATARFLTTVLARPEGGFAVAQAADRNSPDGGAYWQAARVSGAKSPPRVFLVPAGESALAGAALARAAVTLNDPALQAEGKKALDRVLRTAYEVGRGCGLIVEPHPESRRYLTTQADLSFALLDAYETTGDSRYLRAGRDVADFALQNLTVAGESALRDLLPEARPMGLLVNPRRPLPENVRLARALLRLSALDQGRAYAERARTILATYAGDLSAFGVLGVEAALAVEEASAEPIRVRIDGAPENRKTSDLRRAALGLRRVWSVVATGSADAKPAAAIAWKTNSTALVERPDRLEEVVQRLAGPPSPKDPS